jgi:hypothetical protein
MVLPHDLALQMQAGDAEGKMNLPPQGELFVDAPSGVPAEVCAKFEELALSLHDDGWRHYSADAILHRIRWHFQVEKGNRAFRCNNNWTAPLARWFLRKHPELNGFFELRERTDDGYREEAAA